ncbi:MAG: KEOPS complex subunit Pcc1 [Candidatus Thermoplasmatota archaeon]|nr:KEOPS complex subunit Pcc1 [Candidatus Thermoplasmatota archaeon]
MNVSCIVAIKYDDQKTAQNVLKSIEVDDFNFVKSLVREKTLEAHIESKSISSLIHTLDDFLACISVAEKIVGKT